MKNLIVIIALLLSTTVMAQKFEGTIKWSMKMDITDPKQKAQMEDAQKQMGDPANQAKMKEMQAKMNDPQFKAMMESNPQMKAQIDKMMSAMQSGGNINSMIPKGFEIKIKDENSITKLEGGMFASEILHLKGVDKTYTIDRANKTYSELTPPAKEAKSDTDVKVTKTSETAKILNYTCTKYIVEISGQGDHKVTQNVWATTEIKDIDLKSMAKNQHFGKGQRMYFDKIDGVPLKVEMKTPEANISMEVTEVKKEVLSATDFTIPSDFKLIQGLGK